MKDRLSIGEFAKIKNITTETLRHYDRVGVLRPVEVNNETGYRYYSLLQGEKLTIITELRKLGMSLDDIKTFFNNKNVRQSLDMLKNEHQKLLSSIAEMIELESSIKSKIVRLESMISTMKNIEVDNIFFEEIDKRYILKMSRKINSTIDFNYSFEELGGLLKEATLALANNSIGTIVHKDEVDIPDEKRKHYRLFMFIDEEEYKNEQYVEFRAVIDKGMFACMYTHGPVKNISKVLRSMKDKVLAMGYEVTGDCLEFNRIDPSVTDKVEEELYEIQIPIRRI